MDFKFSFDLLAKQNTTRYETTVFRYSILIVKHRDVWAII